MFQSPTKAVYNARHWALESEEAPPATFLGRSPPAPVSSASSSHEVRSCSARSPLLFIVTRTDPPQQAPASAGGSSKEPKDDAPKDDGVFKAPPPPPKVTKFVTLPTDLYQDAVTALKCRKEHKEVRGADCRCGGTDRPCHSHVEVFLET